MSFRVGMLSVSCRVMCFPHYHGTGTGGWWNAHPCHTGRPGRNTYGLSGTPLPQTNWQTARLRRRLWFTADSNVIQAHFEHTVSIDHL